MKRSVVSSLIVFALLMIGAAPGLYSLASKRKPTMISSLLTSPRPTSESESKTIGSLCHPGEKIIFSCSLRPNGKIVSLCGSKVLSQSSGYIQYRFGVPSNVELEFPSDRDQARTSFHYHHYFRALFDETEISFSNNGFTYTIFDYFQAEQKPQSSSHGLRVSTTEADKTKSEFKCAAPVKTDYGTLGDFITPE